MSKKTKKEPENELIRYGIIKDKRRRMVMVTPPKQEGLRIMDRELKIVGILDGQRLWAVLVFVLMTGLLKLPLILGVLASVVIYVAFELYKRFVFLKDRQILPISDTDYEQYNNKEALTVRKSDAFMGFMLPILLAIVLISRNLEVAGFTGFDIIVYYVILGLSAMASAYSIMTWFKLRKQIKAL